MNSNSEDYDVLDWRKHVVGPDIIERVNTGMMESFTFYPQPGTKIECHNAKVVDIFANTRCRETRKTIQDLVQRGKLDAQETATILTSDDINYANRNVKTFVAVFTSLIMIDKGEARQYYILGREYTKDAFYEFIKLKPVLKELGEQFWAYDKIIDEKNMLKNEIEVTHDKFKKSNELKI